MKASKLVGFALAAAVLSTMVLLPAAQASAKGGDLILEKAGKAVADGSAGAIGITVQECGIYSNGKVTTNDSKKDVVTGSSSSNPECPEPGQHISGLITQISLGSTGKATMKGTITVAASASCSYAFKNPKGSFSVPGFTLLEGKATGKLVKGSSKSCAKTDPQTIYANVTNEVFGEPFEASLS